MIAAPHLAPLAAGWTVALQEARAVVAELRRTQPATGELEVIPLFPDAAAAARLAPLTIALARAVPGVRAAALSILPPGARSPARSQPAHWTGVLCLQGGGASHLLVDGQRHELVDGELLVFPPALPREAFNSGGGDRLALLFILDPPPAALKQLAIELMRDVFVVGRTTLLEALAPPALVARVGVVAAGLRHAFPDLALELAPPVAEGAIVVAFWQAQGTQSAYFYNVPATGARLGWSGWSRFVFSDGRLTDLQIGWDLFTMLQQLRAALRA